MLLEDVLLFDGFENLKLTLVTLIRVLKKIDNELKYGNFYL